MKTTISTLVLTACVLGTCTVHAQEFAGMLRDENALGLTPTASSMAMGGTYVGVPGVTSMNPAALGFVDAAQAEVTGTYWTPGDGPDVYGGRIDLVLPILGAHGRLMVHHYSSDGTGTLANGLDANFDSTTLGLQLGLAVLENLSIGIGAYPYEKANVDLYNLQGKLVGAEAMSQLGSVQAGVQWQVVPAVTLGVEGIYIIDELKAEYNGAAAGVPDQEDDYHAQYIAVGASWQIGEATLVAGDLRWGEIKGESSTITPGTQFVQDVERWHIGIEHRLVDEFVLRAGSNYGGFTFGAGLDISEQLAINYTYVNDAFRDKGEVFGGQSQTHTVSISYTF